MLRIMRIPTDKTSATRAELLHGDITGRVIGAFYEVYNELGYGYLEAVYASALEIEFQLRDIPYLREYPLPVFYKGRVAKTYRADFLVESVVVAEVKAGRVITDEDRGQLLNYLKCTRQEVGLILHFGPKAEFHRLISSRDFR